MDNKIAKRPPPHHSSSSSSHSPMLSSSGGNNHKSSCHNSSYSLSNSSATEEGKDELDARLRSVLSHHLGLPLLFAMYEKKAPEELRQLFPTSKYQKDKAAFTHVLNLCVPQWIKERAIATANNEPKKPGQRALTSAIVKKVKSIAKSQQKLFTAHNALPLTEQSKPDGSMDIVLSPVSPKEDKTTTLDKSNPLMVMQVGINSHNWFEKFYQGTKFLQQMCKTPDSQPICFEKPLLFAVITIDNKVQEGTVEFQMGVFLCTRKYSSKPGETNGNFRMMLLRQFKTKDQKNASNFFGLMLWLTEEFNQWREKKEDVKLYEYFSSNCCRIGDWVRGLFCFANFGKLMTELTNL